MTTLNKWRIYCNTEADWVTKWEASGITPNTTCFNDPAHSVNANSLYIMEEMSSVDRNISNLPLTCFSEVRVAEKTHMLDLKSTFGKSTLRDIYTTEGTGSITNNAGDPSFLLEVSGSSDIARIQSAERGRYISGCQAEVGLGILLPQQTLTGNQVCKFGYYDGENGFYFKYTASGLSVCILKAGVETCVTRANWNRDILDGTGPSKHVLNFTKGMIFKIIFSWYGYGNINFYINTSHHLTYEQQNILVHSQHSEGSVTVKNPNLPIRAELSNNGTTGTLSMHLSGRQYSVIGRYNPIERECSTYVTSKAINSTSVFVPILSIKKKSGYLGTPVKILSFDIINSTDIIFQIRVRSTLTGASFGNLVNIDPADTAIEFDSSASAMTGGIPIFSRILSGDSKATSSTALGFSFMLTEYDSVTVCAKGTTLSNGSATCLLKWTEEW